MVIAVNAGFSLNDQNKEYRNFIFNCFNNITRQHSRHKFIFISDKPFDASYIFTENSIPVIVSYKFIDTLFQKLLLKKKVSFILKKYKADVFITDTEIFIPGANIPQCMIIRYPYTEYKINKIFLEKLKIICSDSEFLKSKIAEQYRIAADKIHAVYDGIDDVFQPIDYKKREVIKDQYAEGKEYFLCTGIISSKENLINLLKAFSVFKKRLKSSMQLLITGKIFLEKEELSETLTSYKHKDEVKVFGILSVNEIVKVIASAYAVVSPFYPNGMYLPVLQIVKCEIPIITNNTEVISEVCADTVIYADPNDHNDIANKMMLIFKDENLRHQLIAKGKENVLKYTWDKTSKLFWEAILKFIKTTYT